MRCVATCAISTLLGAGVLPLNAHRGGALLEVAGLSAIRGAVKSLDEVVDRRRCCHEHAVEIVCRVSIWRKDSAFCGLDIPRFVD